MDLKRQAGLLLIGFAATVLAKNATTSYNSNRQLHLLNGRSSDITEVPFIVSLNYFLNGTQYVREPGTSTGHISWWCTGSIIGEIWVLTASFCAEKAISVTIYYGSTKRVSPLYFREVHGNNIFSRDSISLIRTPKFPFSAEVNKITLPDFGDDDLAGKQARLYGWSSIMSPSLNMMQQDYKIIKQASCRAVHGKQIKDNDVCIASTDESACLADYGGPLVLLDRKLLVGVAWTIGKNDCRSLVPIIFKRISHLIKWIRIVLSTT